MVHFIPADLFFVSRDSLQFQKCAFQWDGSTTSPLLSSPFFSLFTFLPHSMSHQECHQHPLRLMPVNMATLLSAQSLLLSLLFAVTLDEFIKGRKKGGNSCGSSSFPQLTVPVWHSQSCLIVEERTWDVPLLCGGFWLRSRRMLIW